MKKYLLLILIVFAVLADSAAQPFALAMNNVDGSPFTCNLLEDLGVYKRLRVQATQNSSSATWEFPALCSFPGNVWRPYTAGTPPIPFNTVIPPIPNTAAALYNAGNGGASGNLSPVTLGRYYTFNVENIFTPTGSPYISVLETATFPVVLQTVSQSPVSNAVGENVPVTVTINTSSDPVENVFVRYTTDNFVSTNIVQAVFTGSVGTAVIPGFPLGTNVKYYIYSSPNSQATIEAEAVLYGEIVHDMSTLEWNTNIGQNFSYTVITVLPVNIEYFKGVKSGNLHLLSWKVNCLNTALVTLTIERSSDALHFTPVYSVNSDLQRCLQPFAYTDSRALPGINYYRLKMKDANGAVNYSTVIALLNRETGFELVSLLPTLVRNNMAFLEMTSAEQSKVELLVNDISGRQVQRISKQLIAGSNRFALDFSALAKGTYYLSAFSVQGRSRVIRFVKQ